MKKKNYCRKKTPFVAGPVRSRLAAWCGAVMLVSTLSAVPVIRRPLHVTQADGSVLTLLPYGDENVLRLTTVDGFAVSRTAGGYYVYSGSTIAAHDPQVRTADEKAWLDALPESNAQVEDGVQLRGTDVPHKRIGEMQIHKGSPKIPVILVAFADKAFSETDPAAGFYSRICRPATLAEVEAGKGSAYQYFTDQSNGIFTPQFEIVGPVTLSGNEAVYVDHETDMVAEAAALASAQGLVDDWARYDNDGDGIIDAAYIVYAGEGRHAHPNDFSLIWPHTSVFLNEAPEIDGMKFYSYSCCNETLYGEIDGFGTFCHEFSHQLGLPDFYRTDGVVADDFNMGPWSIMDYGGYNGGGFLPIGYRALEKMYMGWIESMEIGEAVSVSGWADYGQPFKVTNDVDNSEYYILETVNRTGWNKEAPAGGMLVTHVNLSGGWNNAFWKNNTVNNAYPPRVAVIAADNDRTALVTGVNEPEYNESLKGDTYPSPEGNNELTDNSVPAAEAYVGFFGVMGKPITNIAYDAVEGRISFDFMGGSEDNVLTSLKAPEVEFPVQGIWRMDGTSVDKSSLRKGIYLMTGPDGKVVKRVQK